MIRPKRMPLPLGKARFKSAAKPFPTNQVNTSPGIPQPIVVPLLTNTQPATTKCSVFAPPEPEVDNGTLSVIHVMEPDVCGTKDWWHTRGYKSDPYASGLLTSPRMPEKSQASIEAEQASRKAAQSRTTQRRITGNSPQRASGQTSKTILSNNKSGGEPDRSPWGMCRPSIPDEKNSIDVDNTNINTQVGKVGTVTSENQPPEKPPVKVKQAKAGHNDIAKVVTARPVSKKGEQVALGKFVNKKVSVTRSQSLPARPLPRSTKPKSNFSQNQSYSSQDTQAHRLRLQTKVHRATKQPAVKGKKENPAENDLNTTQAGDIKRTRRSETKDLPHQMPRKPRVRKMGMVERMHERGSLERLRKSAIDNESDKQKLPQKAQQKTSPYVSSSILKPTNSKMTPSHRRESRSKTQETDDPKDSIKSHVPIKRSVSFVTDTPRSRRNHDKAKFQSNNFTTGTIDKNKKLQSALKVAVSKNETLNEPDHEKREPNDRRKSVAEIKAKLEANMTKEVTKEESYEDKILERSNPEWEKFEEHVKSIDGGIITFSPKDLPSKTSNLFDKVMGRLKFQLEQVKKRQEEQLAQQKASESSHQEVINEQQDTVDGIPEISESYSRFCSVRRWGLIRKSIMEKQVNSRRTSEASMNWRMLCTTINNMTDVQRGREALYKKYIYEPNSWLKGFTNLPPGVLRHSLYKVNRKMSK